MRPARPLNRTLFEGYSYLSGIVDKVMNLMPPPIRWAYHKVMLKHMGRGVYIDYDVYLRYSWKVSMGDDVFINRRCCFYCSYHAPGGQIIIGNNVRLGPHTVLLAAGHDYEKLHLPDTGAPIVICDNVWIGGNSTILHGVTIGEGAVVAAGSVVTHDLLPYRVYGGVPAREIKQRNIE